MDFRFQKRLRPVAIIVLVTFSWMTVEPWNYLAWAQSRSNADVGAQFIAPAPTKQKSQTSSKKFEESLRATQKLLEDLDQEVAQDKDITLTLEALKGHKQDIEAADPEIRAEFSATEAFLKEKKLPAVILDRHTTAVADYDSNYKTLKANLDSIIGLEADRKQAEAEGNQGLAQSKLNDLKAKIKTAQDHLQAKVKKPRHQPLDPNNLPHRTPKVKERKPRLKPEEFTEFNKPIQLAYNGDLADLKLVSHTPTDNPTAADLDETIEVQFTQGINDLAASLGHNPIKIYNWVRNNIDFTPTWGSIQGANHCLLTKQCNAFDTASLLIALLRTSGIPARYVMGTIELPIDQVMNWAGRFTDSTAALNFMASGGIAVAGGITGGKITTARIEHVWVEAYVDMIPSFGAVHKQGDTWVPMDASFKQYTYTNGIDFQTAVPFDAEGFVNQLESTATINETESYVTNVDSNLVQTTLTDYVSQLQSYINQTLPNASARDVVGGKSVVSKDLPVLTETLPYKTLVTGLISSELSNSLRHKITFSLLDKWGLNTELSVTKALPEIAGKKVTLSYSPASSSDESVLLSYVNTGASSLPAYLIRLKPEIRIDGQVVASGNSIGMGETQPFNITLASPTTGSNHISNNLTAGTYNAVVLDLGIVVPDELDEAAARANSIKAQLEANDFSGITKDDIIGEFLHGIGISYWGLVDLMNDLSSRMNGVVDVRLPSEGLFTHDLEVNYTFGVPLSVIPFGFSTDVDVDLHIVSAKDGEKAKPVAFLTQTGMFGSNLEASIYDLTFNKAYTDRGISTAHVFGYANQLGIPFYAIDKNNVNSILPVLQVSSEVKTDIQNAAASGLVVTVPKTNITKDGWTGVGYLVFDPITGAGSYRISGGLSGGGYSCECFGSDPVTELLLGILLLTAGLTLNPVIIAIVSIIAAAVSFSGQVCEIRSRDDLTSLQQEVLIIIAGMMFAVGVGIPILGIPFGVSGVFIAMVLYWLYLAFTVGLIVEGMGNFFSNLNQQGAYNWRRKMIYVA